MNLDPAELVEVYASPRRSRCTERALVLQARQIPHHLVPKRGGFVLAVPAAWRELAENELALYERENEGWPRRMHLPPLAPFGVGSALVYVAVLVTAYVLSGSGAFGWDWSAIGRTHAASIRDGELWRGVTALTLHSDAVHLLSNLIYGTLFGVLACIVLGGGLGWFAILAAGFLGNVTNAWIQDPAHMSVGASTAVFGAVGVLAGTEWRRRVLFQERRIRRAAPLLMAFLLLSYLGVSGERTDVLAHVTGLVWGIPVGAVAGAVAARIGQDRRAQLVLGVASVAVIAGAWLVAASVA